MMKYLQALLPLILFACCSGDKQTESKTSVPDSIRPLEPKRAKPLPFRKYATAYASNVPSFEDTAACEGGCASDYVKLLSKRGEPEHLLILVTTEDISSANELKAITMKYLVASTYDAFAYTDVNQITISCVPMKRKGKYLEKYRITATSTRDKAKKILKKYLHTETFQDLYSFDMQHGLWDSNQKFDSLLTVYADSVFADLNR